MAEKYINKTVDQTATWTSKDRSVVMLSRRFWAVTCATSSTSWTTCTSISASPSLKCSRPASAWRRSARPVWRYTIEAHAKDLRSLSKVSHLFKYSYIDSVNPEKWPNIFKSTKHFLKVTQMLLNLRKYFLICRFKSVISSTTTRGSQRSTSRTKITALTANLAYDSVLDSTTRDDVCWWCHCIGLSVNLAESLNTFFPITYRKKKKSLAVFFLTLLIFALQRLRCIFAHFFAHISGRKKFPCGSMSVFGKL